MWSRLVRLITHERQATAFASQRTVTDTRKVAVLVEAVSLVDGHHALVFHLAIAHDKVGDEPAGLIHVGIVGDVNLLEDDCRRKHGTREEESREMVVRQVVAKRIVGDGEDFALKVFKVADTHDLLTRLRIDDDEVAEAEARHHIASQQLRILLTVLADERGKRSV